MDINLSVIVHGQRNYIFITLSGHIFTLLLFPSRIAQRFQRVLMICWPMKICNQLGAQAFLNHFLLVCYGQCIGVARLKCPIKSLVDDSEYEVFNPPQSNYQLVTTLDQKVHNLQKENELLREKIDSLEQTKLAMSLQEIVSRIEYLEKELKSCMECLQQKKDDKRKAGTFNDNRELLQRATSDQVCSIIFCSLI